MNQSSGANTCVLASGKARSIARRAIFTTREIGRRSDRAIRQEYALLDQGSFSLQSKMDVSKKMAELTKPHGQVQNADT
jgi:hypothetical protein